MATSHMGSNQTTRADPDVTWLHSWIYSQVVNSLLFVATAWMTRSMFAFGARNNALRWWWRRRRTETGAPNGESKSSSGRLVMAALVCLIGSLFTFIVAQLEIAVDRLWGDAALCGAVMRASIVTYIASYVGTYLFMWYRMELLYAQPSVNKLRSPLVRLLSLAALFFIIAGSSTHTYALLYGTRHRAVPGAGCVQSRRDVPFGGHGSVTAASYACKSVTNAIMFALFLYPLKRYKDRIAVYFVESRVGVETSHRLLRAMRLATSGMVACVVSDLAATVVDVLVLPETAPGALINAIWDANLFVNLVSIIICFDGFRQSALIGKDEAHERQMVPPAVVRRIDHV